MNVKRSAPPKKDSNTEKKQFWSKKSGLARKHMLTAKKTNNVGWQKMLKKRMSKYHSHMESFAELVQIAEAYKGKGLWYNIQQKKKKMGKNYRPSKPGSPGRPTEEALKKAQMAEALIQSRKPKKVLAERCAMGSEENDEEFEDDYFSPGISIFRLSSSPYKVEFFPEPVNPEGIISHNSMGDHMVQYNNKDIFWERNPIMTKRGVSSNPDFGELNQRTGTWMFKWFGDIKVSGFIEGEDFIFVKR